MSVRTSRINSRIGGGSRYDVQAAGAGRPGRVLPWLLCAALLAGWTPNAVRAQEGRAAPEARQSWHIAAGPLAPALRQFASGANLLLTFTADQTSGKTTRGLQGEYAVPEALAQLLAGTGLSAEPLPRGGYVLRPVPRAEPAQLAPISVTANQLGEITDGTGSYTTGALATATRLVLTPRETPQSVSVVTRQEMEDFNLTSIDDVMAHMPGVNIVTYDSERTEYYSRGFAIQNFQYDGIPMMRDSAYSAGNTLSDMAIYDRVEVLRGATGLLNGSGYPGATINLIRKKPTYDFQGHITGGAGTRDNYRGELDVSGPLNKNGTVRGRAVAAHQDKHSHLDHYERQTDVFYGIVEMDVAENTMLTLGADYQNNDPTGSTWGGIPIYDVNGNFNKRSRSFNNGARWSTWEQYTRTVFGTLEHYFDNEWIAKLQLNHQINGYDAALGAAASGNPDPADGSGIGMWTGKYVGKTRSNAADLYASGPFQLFGRRHELVVGGSINKRTWTNKGYGPEAGYDTSVGDYYDWGGNVPEPDWQYSYGNREVTRERGAYLTSRFNLRDDLKLITGARVSDYKGESIKESGVVVPLVGLIYDLHNNVSVYGSYSGIFMPQSKQDEQGQTIDPLEGNNYEVGIKGAFFANRLNASLAYFRLEQDNYGEESGGTTPSGGVAYRAVDGVETKGYELELAGALTPRWDLHASFTHKVARQDGDKVDTLSPENQFRLYTTYELSGAFDGLTVGGGARWMDKTWGDVSYPPNGGTIKHTVDDYWVVDAMASYRFNDRLTASLKVNNLLDEEYYTIFSWYSTYTWGEPRNVDLSLTYRF